MKTLIRLLLVLALLPTVAQAQYGMTKNKRLPVINPSPKLKNPSPELRNPRPGVYNPKPGLERVKPDLRPRTPSRRR